MCINTKCTNYIQNHTNIYVYIHIQGINICVLYILMVIHVNCIKCTNCTLVLDVLIVYRIVQIDMCTYTYMVNSVTKYVCVQTHTYIWSRHGKNKKH